MANPIFGFHLSEDELWEMTLNKMIRPTTIPQTNKELMVEQAVAREALQLSFRHHLRLAVGLKGVVQQRSVSDAFEQTDTSNMIDLRELKLVIGSGGALSHAPLRAQTALIMLDAFGLEGITEIAVDSIFMMPHLGILAQTYPDIAMEVLHRDCLIPIATAISLTGKIKLGKPCGTITVRTGNQEIKEEISGGKIYRFSSPDSNVAEWSITPCRGINAGAGNGVPVNGSSANKEVGIIVDARGRPLQLPENNDERYNTLSEWYNSVGAYDLLNT